MSSKLFNKAPRRELLLDRFPDTLKQKVGEVSLFKLLSELVILVLIKKLVLGEGDGFGADFDGDGIAVWFPDFIKAEEKNEGDNRDPQNNFETPPGMFSHHPKHAGFNNQISPSSQLMYRCNTPGLMLGKWLNSRRIFMSQVKIGVIGGSGLYEMDGLTRLEEKWIETPFGKPSDAVIIGELEGEKVAFLPRHGRGHLFTPSEINFRANIYAMKVLGVQNIFSVSAVGSMKEKIAIVV